MRTVLNQFLPIQIIFALFLISFHFIVFYSIHSQFGIKFDVSGFLATSLCFFIICISSWLINFHRLLYLAGSVFFGILVFKNCAIEKYPSFKQLEQASAYATLWIFCCIKQESFLFSLLSLLIPCFYFYFHTHFDWFL